MVTCFIFHHISCANLVLILCKCKGKKHATKDRPPNHHLFEALFENKDGPTKSLLTECRQQRNTVKNPRDPAAPVIHVNFPVDMFHGLHAGLPPVPPAHLWPQPLALPVRDAPEPSLPGPLSYLCPYPSHGPCMELTEFFTAYRLSDGLREVLVRHGFTGLSALCYATVRDVESMELRCGDIAQLKDAMAQWSQQV